MTPIGLISHTPLSAYAIAHQRSESILRSQDLNRQPRNKALALQNFKTHLPRLRKFQRFAEGMQLRVPQTFAAAKLKVIIGSDWVWHIWDHRLNPVMYGDTRELAGAQLYAYAASFGQTRPTDQDYQRFKPYLTARWQQFRSISLREGLWLEELNALNLPCGPIREALDPAFLPEATDYAQMTATPLLNEPYVLLYDFGLQYGAKEEYLELILDEIAILRDELKQPNLAVLDISPGELFITERLRRKFSALKLRYRWYFNCGPAEFVNFTAHAKVLFTDSFHGMVYSLLFNRPFRYFYLRHEDPRGRTLEQNFGIASLMMDPHKTFIPREFSACRQQVQELFKQRFAAMKTASLRQLEAIIKD